MIHLPRFMLAAPSSGSGKTMITCGLLQALKDRGLSPASFKCGPDYIDPMFHSRVIGAKSRNLDPFFADEETVRYLFAKNAAQSGISVLEGVMGFYDGLGGTSAKASSYDLAAITDTPVILVVNARGMSLSVVPLIQGYVSFQRQFGKQPLRGVILNQTTRMTCALLKEQIEARTGMRVYGYVPKLEDCVVESRHLGLVTPDGIRDLRGRMERLGRELEQCLDIDGIVALAHEAPDYREEDLRMPGAAARFCAEPLPEKTEDLCVSGAAACFCAEAFPAKTADREDTGESRGGNRKKCPRVRIAVAMDEAFCFYYQDNLDLLEQMGAQLVMFSPLRDKSLPERIGGLIFGGGYPELYAETLSENSALRNEIRDRIAGGIPYLAECGGFMYLHETMEDMEGNAYPMCGCIAGKSYRTPKLSRFGYITLKAAAPDSPACRFDGESAGQEERENRVAAENADNGNTEPGRTDLPELLLPAGQSIRAHEFHYFDSTSPGSCCVAEKPAGSRKWSCMHGTGKSMAGYPHLYYWSNPEFAYRFVSRARAWQESDR